MPVERRSFPRYPVNSAVEVTLPDTGETGVFAATCVNLSRTSIQVECSAELVVALLRQQRLPYSCLLNFALAHANEPFSISATVVTQRRLSQQQYVLVLMLRHADAAQEERLDLALARQHPIGLD